MGTMVRIYSKHRGYERVKIPQKLSNPLKNLPSRKMPQTFINQFRKKYKKAWNTVQDYGKYIRIYGRG